MGPLALADFIGLDICLSILSVMHRSLGEDKYRSDSVINVIDSFIRPSGHVLCCVSTLTLGGTDARQAEVCIITRTDGRVSG